MSTRRSDPTVRPLKISVRLRWEDLTEIDTKEELLEALAGTDVDVEKALGRHRYERDLEQLQLELVTLQRDVQARRRRVAIVFEGRDAAGKSSSIRRFTENLNPRNARVVALPKPTEEQLGQWYFQRFIDQLPNPGEIVFFDRSWYNRAVVEPVMQYCTQEQYRIFMQQVPRFEQMLHEDGYEVLKLWFAISREEQEKRFASRRKNPLKQWKISPVDAAAQGNWDIYSEYIAAMFAVTHTAAIPWTIVDANDKSKARLESIRQVLTVLDYADKNFTGCVRSPDPEIISAYDPAGRNGS